jgi:hypothetical protein
LFARDRQFVWTSIREETNMKCCCLLTVLAMSLLVVGISVGVPLAMRKVREAVKEIGDTAVREACEAVTSYPETCKETFSSSSSSSSSNNTNNNDDDDGGTTMNYDRTAVGVTIFSLQTASAGVNDTLAAILALNQTNSSSEKGHDVGGVIALAAGTAVCVESLTSSMELLEAAVKELNVTSEMMKSPLSTHDIDWTEDPEGVKGRELQVQLGDVKVWATAAMEMHATCIDAVVEIGTPSVDPSPNICLLLMLQLLMNFRNFFSLFHKQEQHAWKEESHCNYLCLRLRTLTQSFKCGCSFNRLEAMFLKHNTGHSLGIHFHL